MGLRVAFVCHPSRLNQLQKHMDEHQSAKGKYEQVIIYEHDEMTQNHGLMKLLNQNYFTSFVFSDNGIYDIITKPLL
jgi:hypothetical protein